MPVMPVTVADAPIVNPVGNVQLVSPTIGSFKQKSTTMPPTAVAAVGMNDTVYVVPVLPGEELLI
jgi:hypothetical protein